MTQKTRFCSLGCGTAARHAEKRAFLDRGDNKICAKCGNEKPRTEFYARPNNPDGLRAECKGCFDAVVRTRLSDPAKAEQKRLADRAYYEREAERITREARERYAADPAVREATQAYNKASRERHPETMKTYNRNRRLDPEKGEVIRTNRRRHYQENKAVYKAASVARTKHVKRATPPWSNLSAIEALYAQAERMTVLTEVRHDVDHFYPLRSKTMCGLHVLANLRIVPRVVNLRKGNAVPDIHAAPLCCSWPQVYSLLD